jgi:hypothetical protein
MQSIMKTGILSLAVLCAFLLTNVSAADAPATFKVSEFTFTRPANWEWVPVTSSMRKAQLKVVSADKKETAEVVFFHFGQGGGSVKDNVERWFRQFQEPRDKINARSEDTAVGKWKVTYVQAEGTFLSGIPGGPQTPQPNYSLSGAIIESNDGNVFIKMTGPKSLVKTSQTDFKKMVEGPLKPK